MGVAIPARNERDGIATALDAVVLALEHPLLAHTARTIVVVDDNSSDGTGDLARRVLHGRGEVIEGAFGSAAAARRAAFDQVLSFADGFPPDDVWLATTDADSRVPPSWLAGQLRWWREGADAVAGMVTPIWARTGASSLRQRYETMMTSLGTGPGHPHVYGANLGFTAAAYRKGGGVPLVTTGEDRALWEALRSSGARVVSVADDPVATSTRLVGRAPRGFAALLAGLAGER
jgi:glycosyltransferase involved in cell wall biosynthesis